MFLCAGPMLTCNIKPVSWITEQELIDHEGWKRQLCFHCHVVKKDADD